MPKFDLTVVPPDAQKAKSIQITWEGSYKDVLSLKRKIAEGVGSKADELALYFQNPSGPYSYRLQHLAEDSSLKELGLDTKATIVCQKTSSLKVISQKGVESPYYMWNDFSSKVPDDIRVQTAGEPKQLNKDKVAAPEATSVPKRFITNYSWVDDSRREVKIYVNADGEPDLVKAAGDDGTKLEAKFAEQSFNITVPGEGVTHVFAIAELEHPIVPEGCKVKVSPGKRISITLAKAKEDTIWHTLLYRR